MRLRLRGRMPAVALTAVVALGLSTGCSDSEETDDAAGPIVVWSLENLASRVQATQRIVDRFSAETGIEVELVAIDENQFSQLVTSSAAAGTLPDVIGALPMTAVWQMAGNDLVDPAANQQVVDALGGDTFAGRVLSLVRDDDRQLAVPSDAWAQLIVYRKDLFDRAGLQPPDDYDSIRRAAQTLHRDGLVGVSMATMANDAGTGQAFESLAVGNDCQLVDDGGEVALDSPACKETFGLAGELGTSFSAPGAQDVDTTRATYFAGGSAMIMWSSFLLDELAGLRNDALPTCPECAADPLFLARNSGVVTAIDGPSGEPAQFGELTSWTVTNGADRAAATRFVQFMMSDQAYLDWLGMAPEGKIPVRTGTADRPDSFSTAWDAMPAGVDSRKPLSEIYPPEVLAALRQSPEKFQRWGFEQGQGQLVGATLGELPVPKAVNSMLSGTSADEAASTAAEAVRSIQASLR
jgi:multiple sugar transport system substrate-binding protein